MNSLTRLTLIFAIFQSFVSAEETKDFCQAFEENAYKISFGFRRITRHNNFMSYLFIDQHYWKLNYEDSQYDALRKVTLDSKTGLKSNWFGKRLSMAVCIWIPNENRCRAVLMEAESNVIQCGNLYPDAHRLNLEGNADTRREYNIKTNSKFGFVPVRYQLTEQLVTFAGGDPVQYNTMRFKRDCSFEDVDNVHLWHKHDFKADSLKKLHKSLHLVAVLGQNVSTDFPDEAGDEWSGMIFVFQEDRSLLYCISYVGYSSNCVPGGLKTLINCTTNLEQPTKPNETKTTGISWIWIVLIAIIILTVLTIGCVWFKRKRSAEPTSNPSAIAPLDTIRMTDLFRTVSCNTKF